MTLAGPEPGAPVNDPLAAGKTASHADPDLYLQPSTTNLGWLCSGSTCWFAVDFTVPAGAYWSLTEIAIEGSNPAPFYAFDGFNFRIHADDGGKPAAAALFSRTNAPYTEAPAGPTWKTFGFDLAGATAPVLGPGTYWLSFDMVNEAAGFKQAFRWVIHTPPVGGTAVFAGFINAGPWSPLGIQQDLAFSLFGAAPTLDVKPGSAGNPVNLTERGRLPVAVLTTSTFDAAKLDPATVRLGDGLGADTPVAARNNGTLMASLEDVDGDGDLDLMLHFEVPALVAGGDLTPASTRLILNGATTDGTPVRAVDAVRIVGKAV